jgi:hypothetical protein
MPLRASSNMKKMFRKWVMIIHRGKKLGMAATSSATYLVVDATDALSRVARSASPDRLVDQQRLTYISCGGLQPRRSGAR